MSTSASSQSASPICFTRPTREGFEKLFPPKKRSPLYCTEKLIDKNKTKQQPLWEEPKEAWTKDAMTLRKVAHATIHKNAELLIRIKELDQQLLHFKLLCQQYEEARIRAVKLADLWEFKYNEQLILNMAEGELCKDGECGCIGDDLNDQAASPVVEPSENHSE